jgi:putative flippase GtrA
MLMNSLADLNSNSRCCAPNPAPRRRVPGSSLSVEIKRFGVVGVLNTVVDLTVLNALIFLTHLGKSGIWFTAFKGISFLAAVLNSYFINHSWTFQRSTREKSVAQAGQFLIVSLFGAVINISSASYVATYIASPAAIAKYWPSIAALAGTACGLILNFLGYKHIVFSSRRPAAGLASPADTSAKAMDSQPECR